MNFASFKKPSRYIGDEINIIRKEADIKVALCFPDTYEIGMSHLGLKILYSIINDHPDASAERVFAPWVDLEDHMRKERMPLTSLEFRRTLSDFSIVGFTLQYELSYTNILNMIDLGGMPIRSDERHDDHPIVIAGGPCAVNPLPLAPFIDAFVIGDGEEIIIDLIEAYSGSSNKEEQLKALSRIEGVYVPSVHDTKRDRIKKRIVSDLDSAPFPDAPLVPYASTVHDRVAIEVSRGCTKGCRFCQAGMIYRPLRERSMDNVLSLSLSSLSNTGHEEISFTSLSTGEYSCLLPLIKSINRTCSDSHIAVSLPSLRVGAVNKELLEEIKSVRKTGFTIAPEAGTKRLRDIINKDFTEEEYDKTLQVLFSEGWKSLKLYFMVGLPTETRSDIDGIINMAKTASAKGRKITGRSVNINVGISAFVPKPHTPFQRLGQSTYGELREKQDLLRTALRKRGMNYKGQHVELSLLEAVFSRGDEKSSALLEMAWRKGCRFDSWSEMFDFDKWREAADETGIDLYSYAARIYKNDEELPWGFIDTGLTGDFLESELIKALNGVITPDCRDACTLCGLECKDRQKSIRAGTAVAPTLDSEAEGNNLPAGRQGHKVEEKIQNSSGVNNLPIKIRVMFSKTGKMRYLSHNELMTAILRTARRAGLPLSYSAGFHPHPRCSFGPALPSGVAGMKEYFDIELTGRISPEELIRLMNPELPEGIKILSADRIPAKSRSLNDLISTYEYMIEIDKPLEKFIDSFMALESVMVSRKKKDVDVRPMVEKAEVKDRKLYLTLKDNGKIKVRLFEILKAMLNKPAEELYSLSITRTGLHSIDSAEQLSPLRS